MNALRVTLPIPPSTNHLYKTVLLPIKTGPRRGRLYRGRALSDAVVQFRQEVGWAVRVAGAGPDARPQPPYALSVRLFEQRRGSDADNRLKALQDALAFALGFNDLTIAELHVWRQYDPINPRCEVELRTAGGAVGLRPPGGR